MDLLTSYLRFEYFRRRKVIWSPPPLNFPSASEAEPCLQSVKKKFIFPLEGIFFLFIDFFQPHFLSRYLLAAHLNWHPSIFFKSPSSSFLSSRLSFWGIQAFKSVKAAMLRLVLSFILFLRALTQTNFRMAGSPEKKFRGRTRTQDHLVLSQIGYPLTHHHGLGA